MSENTQFVIFVIILSSILIARIVWVKYKNHIDSLVPDMELYYRFVGMAHYIMYDSFAVKYRCKIKELAENNGVNFNYQLLIELIEANKENKSLKWLQKILQDENGLLEHVNYYYKNKLFKLQKNGKVK